MSGKPFSDSDLEPPVPAEPATPAEALRWVANMAGVHGNVTGGMLLRWADELDAARSTDPGPAPTTYAFSPEPPEDVRSVWSLKTGERFDRYPDSVIGDSWAPHGEDPEEESCDWQELLIVDGPLSSVPPGTEASHGCADA